MHGWQDGVLSLTFIWKQANDHDTFCQFLTPPSPFWKKRWIHLFRGQKFFTSIRAKSVGGLFVVSEYWLSSKIMEELHVFLTLAIFCNAWWHSWKKMLIYLGCFNSENKVEKAGWHSMINTQLENMVPQRGSFANSSYHRRSTLILIDSQTDKALFSLSFMMVKI